MKGGLEEAVGKVLGSEHHEILVPRRKNVGLPPKDQLNLFEFYNNSMPQATMGLFYELLGYGLYGGVLYGSRRTPKMGYPEFESNPDTVELEKREMFEYKACSTKRTLILRDGQMTGYANDQVAYPDWSIRPVLFRHSLRDIRSFEGTENELFKVLAKSTLYGLNLPLPVLLELHNGTMHNNGKVVASRSENSSFPSATRVSKGFLNELFFDPDNALTHLGLDNKEYTSTRFVSPDRMRVANKTIRPFPILRIDHVDINAWKGSFVSDRLSGDKKGTKLASAPLYDIPV